MISFNDRNKGYQSCPRKSLFSNLRGLRAKYWKISRGVTLGEVVQKSSKSRYRENLVML